MSHKINDGMTAQQRWLNKPENREKRRVSAKRCRQRPRSKETHRKRQLEYAKNHREQERLRAAKWRKEHPEKVRELDRQKYLNAKASIKEYNRKYRNENREAVSIWQRNRQARKRAGSGKVTRKFILDLFVVQGGICLMCKADFAETGYQIDHIVPLSKGGEHANWNVQLLCPTCNKRKSARTMEEFMRILEVQNA